MSTRSKLLVILQFLCFLYFVLFADILARGLGLIIQIAAAFLCVWAVLIMKPGRFNVQPEIKSNAVFISKGPYLLIRNPMYLGLIIFFAVTVFYDPKLLNLICFFILVLVFLFKIQLEEKFLQTCFGEEYKKYKQKTFRLIPFIYSFLLFLNYIYHT